MDYKRITVRTLAMAVAVICVLLAISVFAGTVTQDGFAKSSALGKELASLKAEKVNCETTITQAEAKIAESQKLLPPLEEKKAAAEKTLKTANEKLDEVCSNNYYSTFSCDPLVSCEELHKNVSKASSELSKIRTNINNIEDDIEEAQEKIDNSKERLANLESDIKRVSSEKTKAFFAGLFFLLNMFVTLAGLTILTKFLLDRETLKLGYIACALMAAASFIYILLPAKCSAFAYLCNIVNFGIFYILISENTEKRVMCRVISIIISIVSFLFTLPFAPISAFLYLIAMILVSLVLVPCVFTEYLDIAKHIFFNIITFGIWQLIWIYNVTENLNKVEAAEKRAPVRELLLCIFLPLYYIFWTYKTAGIAELYGAEKGKQFKIDALCLAFSFIVPLIPSIIIQDKTNTFVGKPE